MICSGLKLLSATTLLLFTIIGCGNKKGSLYQTWFYSFHEQSGKGIEKEPELTSENFINLKADGKYTSYLDSFEYGEWKKGNTMVTFINQEGEKRIVEIKKYDANELTLDLTPDKKNIYFKVFSGIPNLNISDKDNPFSVENNLWRIRPLTPESDQQLTNRLRNYFSFWEKYFNWALINKMETLDIRTEQSPLKLYGNGFELIPYDKISDSWKKCFATDEDCHKSWKQLETLITEKNISWPKTDNRFKSFLAAFQQLQTYLD